MSATAKAKEPKTGKFKKGELVRVVTPLAFVRCGYPLDPGEVGDRMAKEYGKRVRDFLNLEGHKTYEEMTGDESAFAYADEGWMSSRAYKLAVRALASQFLESKGFGGRERTIHTTELPEIKGKVFEVRGWHFNVTGKYCAPSYWPGGWDSPAEYEPGYLDNAKTHRILHLESVNGRPYTHLQIEACHVEKVTG